MKNLEKCFFHRWSVFIGIALMLKNVRICPMACAEFYILKVSHLNSESWFGHMFYVLVDIAMRSCGGKLVTLLLPVWIYKK